jgi:hypothetical protein
MTARLLADIEAIAPSTQINLCFDKGLNVKGSKFILKKDEDSPLPLPVDIHIQDLLRKSMLEENISKVEDVTWLPWM